MNYAVAYRTKNGTAGVFIAFRGGKGRDLYEALHLQSERLSEEVGQELKFKQTQDDPFRGTVSVTYERRSHDENELMAWLKSTANSVISAFRPALKTLLD